MVDEVELEHRLSNIEAMGARIEETMGRLVDRMDRQNGSITRMDRDLREHETDHKVEEARREGARNLRRRDLIWIGAAASVVPGVIAAIAALA